MGRRPADADRPGGDRRLPPAAAGGAGGGGSAGGPGQPAQGAAFRQTRLGRHKTDRADALLLARFAEVHGATLRRAPPAAPQQARLRALVGDRDGLVTQRTQLRNRAAAGDWGGEATVQDWLAADLAAVAARLAEVDAALAAALAELPAARVLQALPGVGLRVAAAVLAYLPAALWGDAKGAAAYAGVHPRQEQSGARARSRLSQQGHRRLRRDLYLAALVAIRHDPGLGAVSDRLVARGKAPQSAVCAVMPKVRRRMMGELRAHYQAQAPDLPLAA